MNLEARNRLALKGASGFSKKAINEALVIDQGLKQRFESGVEAEATIVFLDVWHFSRTIAGYRPQEVAQYLPPYYEVVLKSVNRWEGAVEKVIGDGVIVIFSNLLNELSPERNDFHAMGFLQEVIRTWAGTSGYESKGAIHRSAPYFCRIGNEEAYKEYTVIGEGLTYCFRIESLLDQFAKRGRGFQALTGEFPLLAG